MRMVIDQDQTSKKYLEFTIMWVKSLLSVAFAAVTILAQQQQQASAPSAATAPQQQNQRGVAGPPGVANARAPLAVIDPIYGDIIYYDDYFDDFLLPHGQNLGNPRGPARAARLPVEAPLNDQNGGKQVQNTAPPAQQAQSQPRQPGQGQANNQAQKPPAARNAAPAPQGFPAPPRAPLTQ